MPGVHCISIKLSTSILTFERMMTGRSRTGSLKHLVLFPMFLVVLQRKLQKKMDQVLAPREFRSAYAEKHRQGEPSFTNYAWVKDESNWCILRVHFYWEVSVCFFFFLGGGAEDNKKRETGDTHNFVMGALQRKIGNCEFQWFETSRVINQRNAPNVWRKCCLLAFSFKRGIFLLKETVFLRIHDHLKASGIWMSSSILVCMY